MPRKLSLLILLILVAALGGCSGEYMLTTPDAVALPGQPAPAVVRLQRRELAGYIVPVRDVSLMFRVADQPMRAARTDKQGYAGVLLPAPSQPGRYDVIVHHQDTYAIVLQGALSLYVLEPDRPVVAVDLDSLPLGGRGQAQEAIARLAEKASLLYTTSGVTRADRAHGLLVGGGYPDGPVVPYARPRVFGYRNPLAPIDPSPLAAIKQHLPRLAWGVAADDDSARAYRSAGVKVIGVRDGSTRGHADVFIEKWEDLRAESIAD